MRNRRPNCNRDEGRKGAWFAAFVRALPVFRRVLGVCTMGSWWVWANEGALQCAA